MKFILFISFITVIFSTSASDSTSRSNTFSTIRNGFTLAKNIGDLIGKRQFNSVMSSIVKTTEPYIRAIGPFIALIEKGGDTADGRQLKELCLDIGKNLDQIDFSMSSFPFDLFTTAMLYLDIDRIISSTYNDFERFCKLSNDLFNGTRNVFMLSYGTYFTNSNGDSLYRKIMYDTGISNGGLFGKLMTGTNYDSAKTQSLMLHSLTLLMKAATIEIAYFYSMNYASRGQRAENKWIERLSQVRTKMENINYKLINHH